MLNKQKGNMYGFITHTWNPIRGKCPHDCSYCYMKVFKNVGELRLDEKSLQDCLGYGNFIFVGSSTDMFADNVPSEWINKVLDWCEVHDKNTYLFQTKNPKRFQEFEFPTDSILGITMETNRDDYTYISKAPSICERWNEFPPSNFKQMISIEPILDFDLDLMITMVKKISPKFVSIGADSKGHNLPEPSTEKINNLIKELRKFTEVKIKDNLRRLRDFTK